MFCPTVNGVQVIKSNFTIYWGIEPAQLTATVPFETPPSEITYGGYNISLNMHVINWTKVEEGIYIIQAADDPYFWKNLRLTVKHDDPINGVPIVVFADAIANETGWTVELESDEVVPYLLFSGSVVEAIEVLERLSGKFATLDHLNKKIVFVDSIPNNNAPEGIVIEEGSSAPTASNVVCYGTLLKLAQDNFSAASEMEIDEFKFLDMAVPSEGWEITTATPLGTSENIVGTVTEYYDDYRPYDAGTQFTTVSKTTEFVERGVNIVFIATTLALKQDEVLLVPPIANSVKSGDVTLEVQTREFGGEVYFEAPTGAATVDIKTGKPNVSYVSLQIPNERVFFLANPDSASTKANEILDTLSSGSVEGIFIIVTPNYSNTSETTTSDYYFGFRAFVIGRVFVPYLIYQRVTEKRVVNGVLREHQVSGLNSLPDAPVVDNAFISLYLRERLLRNLRFKVLLDGYRVKFPYFVDAFGNRGKVLDPNQDSTMFIQLNEAPSIEAAISYAKLSLDVLKYTGYVGVLDASPDGTTKYVEDFGGSLFRAIGYFRK